MASVLTLLIVSIVAGSDGILLPLPAPYGQAPDMPTIAEGLPPAQYEGDRVCYPWKRFDALSLWIEYAKGYPRHVCQPTIDMVAVGCRMRADNALFRAEATHKADVARLEMEASRGWSPWVVGAMAVGLVVVSAAGGFLAGHYLSL